MKLELYYPVKPVRFNQHFGEVDPKYSGLGLKGHNGDDYFALDGTEIRASHDGTVTFVGEDGAGGLTVVLRTNEEFDYLDDKAFFKTIYCHIKKNTFKVLPGQKVKAGDLLALADNTGFSTGSHLHFGLKPMAKGEQDWTWYNVEQNNGYMGAIDPSPYYNGKCAADLVKIEKPTYKFYRNLGIGSWGTDVFELQKRLVKENLATFTPTGYFGGKTLEAVVNYQIVNGIKPITGYCGPLTRTKLNS